MAGGLLARLRLCRLAPLRASHGARTERPPPALPWRRRAGTEHPPLPWQRWGQGWSHLRSRGGGGGQGWSPPSSHGGGGQGQSTFRSPGGGGGQGWSPPRSHGGGRQGRSLPAPVAAAGGRDGATTAPVAAAGGGGACLLLPRQAGAGVPRLPHGPRGWQHGAPSSLPRAVANEGRRDLPRPPCCLQGASSTRGTTE